MDERDAMGSAVPFRNETQYCILIFVFCFICISMILQFWLSQRIHEMKIRRAFGYSTKQILMCLMKSLCSIIFVSTVIFISCLVLLHIVFHELFIEYNLFFSKEIAGIYILIFLASFVIISIYPIYCFFQKGIAEQL